MSTAGSTQITIKVNGEEHQLPKGSMLGDLLQRLGIPERGIAVGIAGEILTQPQFATTRLENGQAIEIVRLVGGG